jgi:hypothetical protein
MGMSITPIKQDEIDLYVEELEREARIMGFQSLGEYNLWKQYAAEGLKKFGGHFASALGNLMDHADQKNMLKLVLTWKPMLEGHAKLFQKYIERRNEDA